MSQAPTGPNAVQGGRPQGAPQGAASSGPAVQRQFVSFAFFKLDAAVRRLGEEEKQEIRGEFSAIFTPPQKGLISLSYSTSALKADCDFLLWRIAAAPD